MALNSVSVWANLTNNQFYDNILASQSAVYTVGSTTAFMSSNDSFTNNSLISSGVLIKLTTTRTIFINMLNLKQIRYQSAGL